MYQKKKISLTRRESEHPGITEMAFDEWIFYVEVQKL